MYFTLRKGKYKIKGNAEAFILFYKFFLFRPNNSILFKRSFFLLDVFNLLFIRMIFIFQPIHLGDDYLIKRRGVGINPNVVKVYKNRVNDKYFIEKVFSSIECFKRESYFLKIHHSSSEIKLPKYKVSNNRIFFDFIDKKNLATKVREGDYNSEEIDSLVKKFFQALDKFYKSKKKAFIHGDLTPDNIYYFDGFFHIIDFSDAEFYYVGFDKFVFLARLFEDFYGSKRKDLLKGYFTKKELKSFSNYLDIKVSKKHGCKFFKR